MGEKRSDHHDNKAREEARKELELDITIRRLWRQRWVTA
jgi:hypothetical protein